MSFRVAKVSRNNDDAPWQAHVGWQQRIKISEAVEASGSRAPADVNFFAGGGESLWYLSRIEAGRQRHGMPSSSTRPPRVSVEGPIVGWDSPRRRDEEYPSVNKTPVARLHAALVKQPETPSNTSSQSHYIIPAWDSPRPLSASGVPHPLHQTQPHQPPPISRARLHPRHKQRPAAHGPPSPTHDPRQSTVAGAPPTSGVDQTGVGTKGAASESGGGDGGRGAIAATSSAPQSPPAALYNVPANHTTSLSRTLMESTATSQQSHAASRPMQLQVTGTVFLQQPHSHAHPEPSVATAASPSRQQGSVSAPVTLDTLPASLSVVPLSSTYLDPNRRSPTAAPNSSPRPDRSRIKQHQQHHHQQQRGRARPASARVVRRRNSLPRKARVPPRNAVSTHMPNMRRSRPAPTPLPATDAAPVGNNHTAWNRNTATQSNTTTTTASGNKTGSRRVSQVSPSRIVSVVGRVLSRSAVSSPRTLLVTQGETTAQRATAATGASARQRDRVRRHSTMPRTRTGHDAQRRSPRSSTGGRGSALYPQALSTRQKVARETRHLRVAALVERHRQQQTKLKVERAQQQQQRRQQWQQKRRLQQQQQQQQQQRRQQLRQQQVRQHQHAAGTQGVSCPAPQSSSNVTGGLDLAIASRHQPGDSQKQQASEPKKRKPTRKRREVARRMRRASQATRKLRDERQRAEHQAERLQRQIQRLEPQVRMKHREAAAKWYQAGGVASNVHMDHAHEGFFAPHAAAQRSEEGNGARFW